MIDIKQQQLFINERNNGKTYKQIAEENNTTISRVQYICESANKEIVDRRRAKNREYYQNLTREQKQVLIKYNYLKQKLKSEAEQKLLRERRAEYYLNHREEKCEYQRLYRKRKQVN